LAVCGPRLTTPNQPEYKTGVLPNQHQLEQKDQFFFLLPPTEPQVIHLPRVTKLMAIPAWQIEIGLANLITVQHDATYSVYYISVGSSTRFGCRHPSSGARTIVITVSGID
jgi:hypothetical protein